MVQAVPQWAKDAVRDLPISVPLVRAAELLGVSKLTLQRAEKRGEIRLLRTCGEGGRRLVMRDEIARLLATWSTPVAGRA